MLSLFDLFVFIRSYQRFAYYRSFEVNDDNLSSANINTIKQIRYDYANNASILIYKRSQEIRL